MTAKSRLIDLPSDWDDISTEFPLVPEGEHGVTLSDAQAQTAEIVHMHFRISDEGDNHGQIVIQNYDLTTPLMHFTT